MILGKSKSGVLLASILSVFLNIFFPKRCVDCGKPAPSFVCMDCAPKIEKIKTSVCPACGKISQFGKFCQNCRAKEKPHFSGLIVAARYEQGPIREMIHHLKYSAITDLAEPLSELVCERLERDMPKGGLVVVPVPLHKKRELSRGFNQSELIARFVSNRLNIPGGLALKRVKNTDSQVSLSGDLRRINMVGAFQCVDIELILNKTVLLIDDVTTTGSTLNECAKILRKNGAKQVFGVVVARRGSQIDLQSDPKLLSSVFT